jgi:hypothetical protein
VPTIFHYSIGYKGTFIGGLYSVAESLNRTMFLRYLTISRIPCLAQRYLLAMSYGNVLPSEQVNVQFVVMIWFITGVMGHKH